MEPSSSEIMERLIILRKKVPEQITDIYARKSQYLQKKFSNINIQLHTQDMVFAFPEETFEDINRTHYCEIFSSKLHEQIQLMDILMKMKNNPVSNRIEQI